MPANSMPMSPVDRDWLRMDSPENLTVVDGVVWTSEPIDALRFRDTLQRRMIAPFPKFAMRPVDSRIPLLARWQPDPDFDLDRHLVTARLPEPGDEEALRAYVAAQVSQPLDRRHPMWLVHLIEGVGPGSAALFRLHHSIADGITLARVLLSLTDDGDAPGVGEAFEPEPVSLAGRVGGAAAGAARHAGRAVRDPRRIAGRAVQAGSIAVRLTQVALRPGKPPSAMTGRIGVGKQVLWTRPLPLAQLKRIAHDSGVTLNDVLLTLLADSLSRYLAAAGTPLDSVRVFVPVNLRPLDRPIPQDLGNAFGLMLPALPTGPMGLSERMARVHAITTEYKQSPEPVGSMLVMAALGLLPGRLETLLNRMFAGKAVATVTNVPGPRTPVSLAGAPVAGIVPLVPSSGDIGLRNAFFTYNDQARVSMVADTAIFGDARQLVTGVEDAFAELSGG